MARNVDVLGRRAGDDGLLACGNLRQRHLALALQRRQHQLVIRRKRHANGALDIGRLDAGAIEQTIIEEIQRPARLVGRDLLASQGDRVATRPGIDLEFLFEQRQVLVEPTKKFAGETVVFKGEREVGRVGRA